MMKKVTLLFIGMAFAACSKQGVEVIASPDGNVQVSVGLTSNGAIQYAEKRECRMKQILFYFDEISKKNCGHCDVCVQENTTEDMIRKKVEANMSKTPIEIQEILHQFDPGLRELVLDVLEKMIDGRLLRKHENTILNW